MVCRSATRPSPASGMKSTSFVSCIAYLWEVSPVTFPAGDKARIDTVKSLEGLASPSELESYLREAYDMSRKEAAMVISRIKALTRNVSDSVEAKAIGNIKSIIDSLTIKR